MARKTTPIPPRPTSRSTLYRPSMSSFSTVEVYSIIDANFWYVETGDVPTPNAWAIGGHSTG